MEKRILTCIMCPLSCSLKIIIGNNRSLTEIKGSRCFKGVKYATDEIKNPLRTIITVIKVKNGEIPTVSVKTDKPVPKWMIKKVMENTSKLEVGAPIEIGQTIKGDIDDIEFIATRKVKRLIKSTQELYLSNLTLYYFMITEEALIIHLSSIDRL